jgi:hypothetical protein
MAQATSEKKSVFNENSASGQLKFMDAKTNTVFALVPQVTIPAGATRTLLFSASFNNNVLQLVNGTSTRAEMIVSFGNATANPTSSLEAAFWRVLIRWGHVSPTFSTKGSAETQYSDELS